MELARGAMPHRAPFLLEGHRAEAGSVAGDDPADLPVLGLAEYDGGGTGGAPLHLHTAAASAVRGGREIADEAAGRGPHLDALLVAVLFVLEGAGDAGRHRACRDEESDEGEASEEHRSP